MSAFSERSRIIVWLTQPRVCLSDGVGGSSRVMLCLCVISSDQHCLHEDDWCCRKISDFRRSVALNYLLGFGAAVCVRVTSPPVKCRRRRKRYLVIKHTQARFQTTSALFPKIIFLMPLDFSLLSQRLFFIQYSILELVTCVKINCDNLNYYNYSVGKPVGFSVGLHLFSGYFFYWKYTYQWKL